MGFLWDWLMMMRFPLGSILRNPRLFWSGVSRFATHTTVLSVLYHMPKYQVELV